MKNGLQLAQTWILEQKGRKIVVPARVPPAPGLGGCSSLRNNWWTINVCFSTLFVWFPLCSLLEKHQSTTSPCSPRFPTPSSFPKFLISLGKNSPKEKIRRWRGKNYVKTNKQTVVVSEETPKILNQKGSLFLMELCSVGITQTESRWVCPFSIKLFKTPLNPGKAALPASSGLPWGLGRLFLALLGSPGSLWQVLHGTEQGAICFGERTSGRIPVRGFNHQIYRAVSNSDSGDTSESMKRKILFESNLSHFYYFYSVPSLSSLTHVQQHKNGKVELPDLGMNGKGDDEALEEIQSQNFSSSEHLGSGSCSASEGRRSALGFSPAAVLGAGSFSCQDISASLRLDNLSSQQGRRRNSHFQHLSFLKQWCKGKSWRCFVVQ